MQLELQPGEEQLTAALIGELDHHGARNALREVELAIDAALPRVLVLDFSGMELQPGKIYAIIGANGSGKSTFARILAGIERADRKGKHLNTGSIIRYGKAFLFKIEF